uniref:solute carrier family 23 protein n=1 Tax=Burkholderia gladioli TaxID=28095 RepID=UPI002445E165
GLVIAVTRYGGSGPNPNIPVALGGIIACGVVYVALGALVQAIGTRWIETLMPPVVTGAVVAVIGLNLAPIAVKGVSASTFESVMALVTVLCVGGVAVVAVILVAENLGHIKAVSAMTGTNLDRYVGRAFIGDGLATIVSG